MNYVFLKGRVSDESKKIEYTPGKFMAVFELALENEYSGKMNVTFVSCTAFGERAVNQCANLKRDQMVFIQGKLGSRKRENSWALGVIVLGCEELQMKNVYAENENFDISF